MARHHPFGWADILHCSNRRCATTHPCGSSFAPVTGEGARVIDHSPRAGRQSSLVGQLQ